MLTKGTTSSLGLCAGETVVVKAKEDILRTLDSDGKLDGMPFMPEMVQFCGREFRVLKRAHKTCALIGGYVPRRLNDTVHLDELRCDGSGHDGCQSTCLLFWKEAWLDRSSRSTRSVWQRMASSILRTRKRSIRESTGCSLQTVIDATSYDDSGVTRYSCQATELPAASKPMVRWHRLVFQYAEDLLSGNVGIAEALRVGVLRTLTLLRKRELATSLLDRIYDAIQHRFGGPSRDFGPGSLSKTPTVELEILENDFVRVKSFDEIRSTLDAAGKNRGMYFGCEMMRYCGTKQRVLKRVDRIINEENGSMINFRSPSLILEGVTCLSECSANRIFCPKRVHQFWREIWLEKDDNSS